ncbi:MAG: peptidylprolyl isomerase [Thermoanaerobaculia bacterium]
MKIALVFILFAMVAASARAAEGGNPRVVVETSKGNVVLELDPDEAPVTVENFLAYVDEGFYDGTVFHRVIPDFMNQGGGYTPDLKLKPTRPPIQNEADNGLRNDIGTVAMARKPDPHSATAQFYINTSDNGFLNHTAKDPRGWGYTVFGRVIEGLETVKAISAVATTRVGGMADVPVEPVIIRSARRAEPVQATAE